jgi:CRISPR system Cascade subunit CasD
MMSWGRQSRFTVRDTGTEPTKSAVIGLLCAALGRSRHESIADLAALRMGVRIDREGVMLQDYHTIQDAVRSSGTRNEDGVISIRHYVADGEYLIGLEGEGSLLDSIEAALRQPVWCLYFGRKSFVPSAPVLVGRRESGLLAALQAEALQAEPLHQPRARVRFVLDDPKGNDIRQDVPLDWQQRRFGSRAVKILHLPMEEVAR